MTDIRTQLRLLLATPTRFAVHYAEAATAKAIAATARVSGAPVWVANELPEAPRPQDIHPDFDVVDDTGLPDDQDEGP